MEKWRWNPDSFPKQIGIRSRESVDAKLTGIYPLEKAVMLAAGNCPRAKNWLFDEALLGELITLQGEVMSHERHIWMRWSTLGVHMRRLWEFYRDANAASASKLVRNSYGLKAWMLLERVMDADSIECLRDILHDYNHPVVEFTCCNQSVGVLGWNTIFWEVRTTY
jgi:hypothetical protein